jgi:hypothetical protein
LGDPGAGHALQGGADAGGADPGDLAGKVVVEPTSTSSSAKHVNASRASVLAPDGTQVGDSAHRQAGQVGYTTVRRHWEKARKVNAQGETVTIDPGGPLAEANWAKQRLGRATQALPNGFCGLPVQKTCPHANACFSELVRDHRLLCRT